MRVRLDKIISKSFKTRDKFKGVADYMVDAYTNDLTDEAKVNLSADTALGMAIGEELTKDGHFLRGAVIGTIGTGLALGLGYIFTRKGNEDLAYIAKIKSKNDEKIRTVRVWALNREDAIEKLETYLDEDQIVSLGLE